MTHIQYITLLSVVNAIDDARSLLPSPCLRYYSLAGRLPTAGVNHSCPCWCTCAIWCTNKSDKYSQVQKGAIIYCFICRSSICLFMTTLCVLTWRMFDSGMMNSVQYEIYVLKCDKDKQVHRRPILKIWIIHAGLRSNSRSHVLREPVIIKREDYCHQGCSLYMVSKYRSGSVILRALRKCNL